MTNWEKAASELLAESTFEAMKSNIVGFKRLSDDAIIPTKAHYTDSGFDLYASEDVIIEPGETAIVPTGIAVELPKGFEAQVRPRSGVTAKTKLRVQLGTIDNGFRGELGVIVDNISLKYAMEHPDIREAHNDYLRLVDGSSIRTSRRAVKESYIIRKGDRIAQLVVQALPEVTAVEIDDFTQDSERGEGGFGSSGV